MPEPVDDLVTELVRFVRLTARMRSMLGRDETGVEHSALLLLLPLRQEGPLRITDLAELKQADPSTISRQAAQLVRAGLVRREPDPVDGRACLLALTEPGDAACRRLLAARRAFLSAALHDWPDARVAAFTDLFEQFNSAVDALSRETVPSAAGIPSPPVADQETA